MPFLKSAGPKTAILATLIASALLTACSGEGPQTSAIKAIDEDSFQCIRDLTPVRRFFAGNLYGDLDATLTAAKSETGAVYPAGSIIQLVPGEAMVKREAGYSASTNDWEFFELDLSAEGTAIRVRGHEDVVNRFGGNCLECHAQARPEWDMVCELDHGCDPIPINNEMIRALQKTDPRCPPAELTEAESEALALLMQMTAP